MERPEAEQASTGRPGWSRVAMASRGLEARLQERDREEEGVEQRWVVQGGDCFPRAGGQAARGGREWLCGWNNQSWSRVAMASHGLEARLQLQGLDRGHGLAIQAIIKLSRT